MSKPRSADDLAAFFGLSQEEFERQWNEGARKADARWKTPGIEYERERAGAIRTAGGGQEAIYAQQEKWK